MNEPNRIVFLDWLRVIACFMVILTHSNEPVYLGGLGTSIASAGDAFWSTFFVSFSRCCVPLFVIASSYLLFPLKYDTGTFFKKRVVKVIIPGVVWMILYCIFGGGDVQANFRQAIFNFAAPAGHLWFCYMIVGLYILMPLLSPWAEKASKRDVQIVLAIWLFTTLIPAIRQAHIAVNGHWNVWGEANWSEFGTFYYISGYMGYMLLGFYFRKFVGDISWKNTLMIAIPMFTAGFAIAAAFFYGLMPKQFPFDEPLETAVNMETMERNCTISVCMMTVAAFLVIRKINTSGVFYKHIILPVSTASYGVYLMHIFALIPLYAFWRGVFGTDCFWDTPAVVVCCAVSTFAVCSLVSVLIRKIPVIGKYIVG